jgi:hypothetical protein
MSRLEQRVKPVLLDMMTTARPGSVITLGPDQAATVAAWAIKTAWMREETAPGNRATTPQMRRAQRRDVLPPGYSKIWAARRAGRLDELLAIDAEETTLADPKGPRARVTGPREAFSPPAITGLLDDTRATLALVGYVAGTPPATATTTIGRPTP